MKKKRGSLMSLCYRVCIEGGECFYYRVLVLGRRKFSGFRLLAIFFSWNFWVFFFFLIMLGLRKVFFFNIVLTWKIVGVLKASVLFIYIDYKQKLSMPINVKKKKKKTQVAWTSSHLLDGLIPPKYISTRGRDSGIQVVYTHIYIYIYRGWIFSMK